MKNVKKALIGTTLAGALVVSTGIGTYSWFTSDANTSGQIDNGTLEINHNESFTNPLFELTDFAPSQLKWTEDFIIENTGSLDTYLSAQYNHSVDKASLKQYKVGYVAYKYKGELDTEVMVNSQTSLEKLFNGTTNERSANPATVTNGEVAYGILSAESIEKAVSTNKSILIADGGESGEINSFWGLKPDEKIAITFGVKLADKAGNEYQGVHYAADFTVQAKQVDRGSEYSN